MLTAIINCLTSLLAGFVVFAVLGYMAHIRESTIEELALQGKGHRLAWNLNITASPFVVPFGSLVY